MNVLSIFHMTLAFIFLIVGVMFLGKAGYFSDAASCGEVEYGDERDKCFVDIAIKRKDSSQCGEVYRDDMRYSCYSTVAVLKRDISICDELPDDRKVQCTMVFRGAVR